MKNVHVTKGGKVHEIYWSVSWDGSVTYQTITQSITIKIFKQMFEGKVQRL